MEPQTIFDSVDYELLVCREVQHIIDDHNIEPRQKLLTVDKLFEANPGTQWHQTMLKHGFPCLLDFNTQVVDHFQQSNILRRAIHMHSLPAIQVLLKNTRWDHNPVPYSLHWLAVYGVMLVLGYKNIAVAIQRTMPNFDQFYHEWIDTQAYQSLFQHFWPVPEN